MSSRPRARCRGGGGGWAQISGAAAAAGLRMAKVYDINIEFITINSSEATTMKPQKTKTSALDPPGIRVGVVRGISYGLFGEPEEFVPQARALGAGLIRAYLYWGQLEPEPGSYRWDAVDALLGQLTGDEEVWITLCSASPWGTRVPTDFQPPSPGPRPGRVRGVRAPGGAPVRRAGAVLAVQQRAEQYGCAVGGHRARIRGTADDLLPRGQGHRPGRGGRARRLRLRRVQQRAGQRTTAVLRPPRRRRARRLRSVQRAPVWRPRRGAALPGHRPAVHAVTRVSQAGHRW